MIGFKTYFKFFKYYDNIHLTYNYFYDHFTLI